ncbi:DEAD/DEAH box helicase [Marinithermus hydrothermalis]|uniref:DEAD/DEAH box helicase domain protein n=1 Tax=Marinithermus hydrothermalis (strain DSM 14884 / JCM 11576 / T1) TaxID=869210 RepID=F2NP44_MARHT|nr:DEAD/DEAH box helicase [Marinithermus hydrothermalis]AEB11845.1 Protein of unknown function DUF1998 [Marinithermus hydrothermalis DSM 14884]
MLPEALTPHRSYAEWLRALPGYANQIRFSRLLPARPPQCVPYDGAYAGVLEVLGLEPFAHQAEAFRVLEAGRNLVMATPTASGKSLVFQVPTLKAMLEGHSVLFLYPTKALARDQLERLRDLAEPFGLQDRVHAYDGDTPAPKRRQARERARALLTNPDMLHFGILPRHTDWAHFLARLAFVVVDELHYYRGVFGTHVALLLRRLLRVAQHYGAHPQLIAASATIQNPQEHAEHLFGEAFTCVSAETRPTPREFVLWVPRALDKQGLARRSANMEAAELAVYAAESGLKTLIFAGSRKTAELIGLYAKTSPAGECIRTYRAGYTARERRALEAAFRAGEVRVLVSTSALELGIDIGDLDAVVLVGYPGSINAFWQRAGRAGRSGRRALVLWIPREDPLDEYFLHRPELLLASAPEAAVADPFNPYLYPPHLHCAARELPLEPHEPLYKPALAGPGFRERGGRIYTTRRAPHREIVLRGEGATFTLKLADGTVLGHLDERQAYWEAHPGAIYLHQGEAYLVRNLDLEAREVVLLPSLEDYYTQPRAETEILVKSGEALAPGVWVGRVVLKERVVGYVKRRYVTESVLEEAPLELPELSFETEAIWFHPPEAVPPERLPSAMHALEHTLIGLLPLFVLAERRDIGGVSYPVYPHPLPSEGGPTIFIYDGYPGGVGYARAAAQRFNRWVQAARDLLAECPCAEGCPRCVLSPKCGNGNQYLDKSGALELAQVLAGPSGTPEPLN